MAKSSQNTDVKILDEEFKVHACRLDVSKAQIYKYAVEFYPKTLSHKEKRALAHELFTQAEIDTTAPDVVLGDKFEVLLPSPNLHGKCLYATLRFSDSAEPGAVAVFRNGDSTGHSKRTWWKFVSPGLVDAPTELLNDSTTFMPGSYSNPGVSSISISTSTSDSTSTSRRSSDTSMRCMVVAKGSQIDLGAFPHNASPSDAMGVLAILDKICQRSAVTTAGSGYVKQKGIKTLSVCGNKVFDLDGTGKCVGVGTELCFGADVSTRIIGGKIFRVTQPCHGFFFRGMNLAELVCALLRPQRPKTQQSGIDILEDLLKGIAIRREFGSQARDVIVGVGKSASEQTFSLGENGVFTTVEDYFLQVHRLAIPDCHAHLPCISVGNSQRRLYFPMSFCNVIGGQRARQSLLQQTKEIFNWKCLNAHIEQTRVGLTDKRNKFGVGLLLNTMSPSTLAAFHISIDTTQGIVKPISVPRDQVKQSAQVSGKVLMKEAVQGLSISVKDKFASLPCLVIVFADKVPNNLTDLVKRLFKDYAFHDRMSAIWAGPQSAEKVKATIERVERRIRDKVMKAGKDGGGAYSNGIVFSIWNKPDAKDKDLRAVYKGIKQYCTACTSCPMTAFAVNDVNRLISESSEEYAASGVTPISRQDVDKAISSAVRRLLAIHNASSSVDCALVSTYKAAQIFLAVYVAELEPHGFLVTLAATSTTSNFAYKTCSFVQNVTFSPGSVKGKGRGKAKSKNVGGFPGIHNSRDVCHEELDKIFGSSLSAEHKLIIYRAGVLPAKYIPGGQDPLMQEVDVFTSYVRNQHSTLSFSVVSSSSARLVEVDEKPPQQPEEDSAGPTSTAKSKDRTLLVLPGESAPSNLRIRWGPSDRFHSHETSLTPLYGVKTESERSDFLAEGAIASWAFPEAIDSSKQLAPVAIARKASRYVRRYGMKAGSVEMAQVHKNLQGAVFYL